MLEKKSFDHAVNLYETVRTTTNSLKAEYIDVCGQLVATQAALDAAPLLRVPLDDLKNSVLDFVDACGDRYAQDQITEAISNYACNNNNGTSNDPNLAGLPLRYCDIERAVLGGHLDYATQFATPSKHLFDDRALYFLFAPLVKERLSALMETMTPEQFGYTAIHPDKIGSDRRTRRAEIEALNVKLDELKARRSDLSEKLEMLGVAPAEMRNLDLAATKTEPKASSER